MRKNIVWIIVLLLIAIRSQAGITRIDPPFWWVGMRNPEVQLMIYGENIAGANVVIDCEEILIKRIIRGVSDRYLFIDLEMKPNLIPGFYKLKLSRDKKILGEYSFEFKARQAGSANRPRFDARDAIYLIMPDRFANGNPDNDNIASMLEKADRNRPNGRHGGDIAGIRQHLDYIANIGFTALWINPLLENNMPRYSYHGYAITDFYAIDPRFGTLDDYRSLINEAHDKGIKIIKDMVLNHCGTNHFWVKDPPSADWLNQWKVFTRTNYRSTTLVDPYRSEYDMDLMVKGWFDRSMADLNQNNPLLATYLIQNSIWWIEHTGLDGIRMDTQPYPFKDFMANWGKAILEEYPDFFMVGEAWLNKASLVAYYQKNALTHDDYNSYMPSVFDFPLNGALLAAFNEADGWENGVAKLYETLVEDFLYPNPNHLVTFLDNHDKSRYFNVVGEDLNKLKMALTFLFTTRGIPSVYYGTELLMTGSAQPEHGEIRKDFPGGWPGDATNAFLAAGRNASQNEIHTLIQKLIQLRSSHSCLSHGKLTHFVPNDGVYVYFRYTPDECIMVVLNNQTSETTLQTKRFNEKLGAYRKMTNLLTGEESEIAEKLQLKGKSASVFMLGK